MQQSTGSSRLLANLAPTYWNSLIHADFFDSIRSAQKCASKLYLASEIYFPLNFDLSLTRTSKLRAGGAVKSAKDDFEIRDDNNPVIRFRK